MTNKLVELNDLFNVSVIKYQPFDMNICVNDIKNLLKTICIKFKDNHDNTVEIFTNKKKTIKFLIEKYLKKIEHIELIKEERKDEIQFKYNQNILGLDDNTTMEEYFQNDNNPEIKVIDFDGMLLTKPIEKYSITFQTSQGNTETFEAF